MTAAPELRGYQRELIERVQAMRNAGLRRLLIELATGAGKTVIAAALIADAVKAGWRVLFVAHRRELIIQASQKLHTAGIDHGILLPGFPLRPWKPVQVASIASLYARTIRSAAIDMPPFDLVVIDEAHHARARTYQLIIAAYPDAVVLGLTATPARGDGRGLGNVFEALVNGPSVAELIAARHLVPARVYAPSQPDLTGVRVTGGDYVERELVERVDTAQLIGDVIEHWHRLAGGRRTIVFATGVAHSIHLRDEFRLSGVMVEHIDGTTPADERDAILSRLIAGTVEVVCNAQVLTEGFDCPDVGCLVLARPTKSLVLYRQMVGRGLRPAPGKNDALILDHAGAVFAHGFPDDQIEWSLTEDRRAENKTHAVRGTHHEPALTNCPECKAVRPQGQACPFCGWRPRPKPSGIGVADGELVAVTRDGAARAPARSHEDRRRFYAMLLWIANKHGHRPGWVLYRYRDRYNGAKPPWSWRSLPPVEPEPHVLAWVRSRQIAYAKAKQKREGPHDDQHH
jgi:DNA repair protein RadD